MKIEDGVKLPDFNKDSKEDIFFSEDALRELCKHLTRLIPRDGKEICEGDLM